MVTYTNYLSSQSQAILYPADHLRSYAEAEERVVNGVVTHIYESYGLINGHIFYNQTAVKGGQKIPVSDYLSVQC